jgi:hypothetical protein
MSPPRIPHDPRDLREALLRGAAREGLLDGPRREARLLLRLAARTRRHVPSDVWGATDWVRLDQDLRAADTAAAHTLVRRLHAIVRDLFAACPGDALRELASGADSLALLRRAEGPPPRLLPRGAVGGLSG